MPELPEVQTIVRDLNKKIIGRKIIGVWFDAPKIIKFVSRRMKPKDFEKQIKGLKIENVKRRGKNILIYLSDNHLLLIHQKLTGHLLVGKWQIKNNKVVSLIGGLFNERVNNYIHLIFYFDDGWQLGLSDLRKFAKVIFGKKEEIENLPEIKNLGPEPLDKSFKFVEFIKLIRPKKGRIKQVLMDQNIIAGIGNIYADEILWFAKIYPFKPANKLRDVELKKIYSTMKSVLKKSVKLRGTSISDYRDTSGKVGGYGNIRKAYQREGEPCEHCGNLIKRVKLFGRSTHFCPKCQIS
ncbi:DNA-formamidopyrimidine glycosylase [Candidatus Wolfebacteria bacterium]|nr:DNA-formamidopyrimidine glycosylase [Candidatus Wolfebacteria bacterium]